VKIAAVTLASPRAVFGHEGRAILPHEPLLLAWRELDHSPQVIVMEGREDPTVDSVQKVQRFKASASA
jgi:hypothetical protein